MQDDRMVATKFSQAILEDRSNTIGKREGLLYRCFSGRSQQKGEDKTALVIGRF